MIGQWDGEHTLSLPGLASHQCISVVVVTGALSPKWALIHWAVECLFAFLPSAPDQYG